MLYGDVACRQLQGAYRVRGIVTVCTTASSVCTAFLLWRYKPQVIKVRGELAHTLVQFGKSVGDTLRLTQKSMRPEGSQPSAGKLDALQQVRACTAACAQTRSNGRANAQHAQSTDCLALPALVALQMTGH